MQKSKLSIGLLILAVVMVTGNSFGAPPQNFGAPDAGSSALLVSIACASLAVARRFLR